MNLIQKYKKLLLEAGFSEAKKNSLHYFKETNNYVAFIVDIVDGDGIEIYYGFASTAFTRIKGDGTALINHGVSKDDIALRQKTRIYSEKDELCAEQAICEYYQKYRNVSKEQLLILAKEKRKNFIDSINDKLKPLGFKKKNSNWTRALNDEYYVSFYAQKSAYSDRYYFNIYIGLFGTNDYGDCFYTRVSPGNDTIDWQLISAQEFMFWLNSVIENILMPIITTPLSELGARNKTWEGCTCQRNKCENCWVQKNLWEARGDRGR